MVIFALDFNFKLKNYGKDAKSFVAEIKTFWKKTVTTLESIVIRNSLCKVLKI